MKTKTNNEKYFQKNAFKMIWEIKNLILKKIWILKIKIVDFYSHFLEHKIFKKVEQNGNTNYIFLGGGGRLLSNRKWVGGPAATLPVHFASSICTPLPPTSAALAHAIYIIGNIILIGIYERNPIENTQKFRLRRCRNFMTASWLLLE